MFEKFAFLLAFLLVAAAASASEVAALLKKADFYRLPERSARVETSIERYKHEALDKERRYTVYIKPGRRSLVLMKSPAEIGQKVLMLADQFWLLMPESQRPLRISASQKLLGEAASGDIATMTWSEDYDGVLAGEAEVDGVRCLRLDLAAVRPGVTYARVELYLEKASKRPVKADLYVDSGKRAKEARYQPGTVEGQTRIVAMSLVDAIQTGRHTLVRYERITAHETPDAVFNPAALARNSLAGW